MTTKLLLGHYLYGKLILAPLYDITEPAAGRIVNGGMWWFVLNIEGVPYVSFFESYSSAQANQNRVMLDMWEKGFIELCEKNGVPTPDSIKHRWLNYSYIPRN